MLIGKNPLNEAPDWFVKNIENRPEECSVSVNGHSPIPNILLDDSQCF